MICTVVDVGWQTVTDDMILLALYGWLLSFGCVVIKSGVYCSVVGCYNNP